MKSRSYSSEGIVLARRNFGEADRILSLYTRNKGRISFIAKGVRRPKSRKRGHLEVFNLVSFQGMAGHGMDIMIEAEVIDDFKVIRKSLSRVSLAYYFCEVVGKITHEGEPNHEVFDLLVNNLTQLKSKNKLKELRLNFIKELLTVLGYWPKGETLSEPDKKLEEVIERGISSFRVGKILSS